MKIVKQCARCGKDFLVHRCHADRGTMCSRACRFPNPKPKVAPKYRRAVRLELEGHRFGMWLVISKEQPGANGRSRWRCRCDCGKESVVSGSSLAGGITKSCGCRRSEITIATHTIHGEGKAGSHTV